MNTHCPSACPAGPPMSQLASQSAHVTLVPLALPPSTSKTA
jgi:hypothetical protein